MAAAHQLRKSPVRARGVQDSDEGRRRDQIGHRAASIRRHAPSHARGPAQGGAPPRPAGPALGPVTLFMDKDIMRISGESLIGQHAVRGTNGSLKGTDAALGTALEPAFGGATAQQLEEAFFVFLPSV